MKKLAIVSAICLSSIALSGVASASQQVTYSTVEYCSLSSSIYKSPLQKRFLSEYAKKLGATPSKGFCKEIVSEKFASQSGKKNSWNFRFNKPYEGSVIRLSSRSVQKLKLEKALGKNDLASR